MKFIRCVLLANVAALLGGCGSYYHFVDAAVDPSLRPMKSDRVFVTVPNPPSIRERQLVIALKEEMCRGGFQVAKTIEESTWVLGLTSARNPVDTGTTSTATAIPLAMGLSMAVGSTQRTVQTNQFAQLRLFSTQDFLSNKQLAVWEGQVAAENQIFSDYEPTIFRNLLDAFGKNISESAKIDKSYYRQVTRCDPEKDQSNPLCRCSKRRFD